MIEQTALPPAIEPEAKTWAMACHLSALSAVVGLPFGHVLGPLVCWLLRRDRYAFVDDQGKEALNFQLSMTIYGFIATLLSFILIGIPLLIALVVVDLALVIIATVRSNEGEAYRYPMTIRFIH